MAHLYQGMGRSEEGEPDSRWIAAYFGASFSGLSALFQDFAVPELCLPLPKRGQHAGDLMQWGIGTTSADIVPT